jgi:TRAP-type C4-dicarboxylate transport system permease small subunit
MRADPAAPGPGPRQDTPAAPAPGAAGDLSASVGEVTRSLELQDPDAGCSRFDRLLNRTVETAGVMILAVMLAIVFVNASGRYVLGWTLIWGDEIVIALMPWLAVLGLFLAVRRGQAIRIDFFLERMRPGPRRAVQAASDLLAALVFLYVGWVALQYVQLFGSDRTVYLDLPTGLFSSSLVAGAVITAVAYALSLWRELGGRT